MKQELAFTITVLVLLVASCRKEVAITRPTLKKLETEGLAYVQLPKNKYFIYKDSTTGMLDSVVVTGSDIEAIFVSAQPGLGFYSGNDAYFYETFTLILTKYDTAQQEWFYGVVNSLAKSFSLRERDRINNAEQNIVFSYPINTLLTGVDVSIMPANIIEDKLYSNIAVFTSSNGAPPTDKSYHKSTYYWVRGVGIIKREIQTGSSIKTELLVRNG